MLPPAIVAVQVDAHATARAFFYSGILIFVLAVIADGAWSED